MNTTYNIIGVLLIGGLAYYLTSCGPKLPADKKYVTEEAFKKNTEKQAQMNLQTLEQLRKLNVTPENELKLEYFFYTNAAEKAEKLANELKNLGYKVERHLAPDSKTEYVITGWTTKTKMADDVVTNWCKQMCELGYKYDCDFDGWGTEPNQE